MPDLFKVLKVLAEVALPATIAIFTYYYNQAQQEVSILNLQTEIVKSTLRGSEKEKNGALDFAHYVAKRTNDYEFERVILSIAAREERYGSVKIKARQRNLEIELEKAMPDKKDLIFNKLEDAKLKGHLEAAISFYRLELYNESTDHYEKAFNYFPTGLDISLGDLASARHNKKTNPKKACSIYYNFFHKFYKTDMESFL